MIYLTSVPTRVQTTTAGRAGCHERLNAVGHDDAVWAAAGTRRPRRCKKRAAAAQCRPRRACSRASLGGLPFYARRGPTTSPITSPAGTLSIKCIYGHYVLCRPVNSAVHVHIQLIHLLPSLTLQG